MIIKPKLYYMSNNKIFTVVYFWCKSGAKGAKVQKHNTEKVQKVQEYLTNKPFLNQLNILYINNIRPKGAKVQEFAS